MLNVVRFMRCEPHGLKAKLPTKGTEGSAYWELYTAEPAILFPGDTHMVTTGWRIEVPPGYFLDLRSRSGLASRGIWLANAPGVVDEDYRGELKMIIHNGSHMLFGIGVGDRLAQCALMPIVHTSFEEVQALSETKRGEKGYGSTGK